MQQRRPAAAQNAGPSSSSAHVLGARPSPSSSAAAPGPPNQAAAAQICPSLAATIPGAGPSLSSSLPRSPGEISSATTHPNRAAASYNYARNMTDLRGMFIHFLKDLLAKHKLVLLWIPNSPTYTIQVSHNQLCEYNKDLMINLCQSQRSLENWLIPAAEQFLIDSNLGYNKMIHKTCLSFIDFPDSVQKLQNFLSSDHLSESVKVFRGNLTILAATVHGRRLIKMLIVALLKSHSKGISWDGTFSTDDIVVIDSGSCCKQMKILKMHMKENICLETMRQAKVKDLKKVAELINQYYKTVNGTLPVYFSQLKEDLDGATNQLVEKPWYQEYLKYHVALMPSTARRYLETMLYAIYKNCYTGYIPFLLAKPSVYLLTDWRSKLMNPRKDYIMNALHGVYSYQISSHQGQTDRYENSVRGLMKFKRNFLEHGGQGQVCVCITELELCAAKMFDEFLPSLVRTLLEQGKMETVFGEAWKHFKAKAQSDL